MSLDILEKIEQIRQELYELEYAENELKDELIELEMRAGLKKEDGAK